MLKIREYRSLPFTVCGQGLSCAFGYENEFKPQFPGESHGVSQPGRDISRQDFANRYKRQPGADGQIGGRHLSFILGVLQGIGEVLQCLHVYKSMRYLFFDTFISPKDALSICVKQVSVDGNLQLPSGQWPAA